MHDLQDMNKRPKLKIPLCFAEKVLEAVAITGVVLSLILLIKYWPVLDRVPQHFGISGKPDAWSGKRNLLTVPILNTVLYLFLTLLCKFPWVFNYPWQITEENAHKQYFYARVCLNFIKAQLIWTLLYTLWQTIRVAEGQSQGMGVLFGTALFFLPIGTIGLYLYISNRSK